MENKLWMETFAKRCQAGTREVSLLALLTWERGIKQGAAAPAKPKCLKSRLFQAAGQHQLQMSSAGWGQQGGCARSPRKHGCEHSLFCLCKVGHRPSHRLGQGAQGRVAWLRSWGLGHMSAGPLSDSWTFWHPFKIESQGKPRLHWQVRCDGMYL